MGWTVLYIAFGIVALWLLGEVLLQYKARLRWRLLAFAGFLGVVVGVLMPSVIVIGIGAIAFAIGQTYVTLSFRRGFAAGWAVKRPDAEAEAEAGGGSKRRRGRADRHDPALDDPEQELVGPEDDQDADRAGYGQGHGDYDDYDRDDVFASAGHPATEPTAAETTTVYEPQPMPEDTGSYGVYGDTAYAAAAQPQGAEQQNYAYDYSGYGQQGYGYYDGGQQGYANYSDPYIGSQSYDGASYDTGYSGQYDQQGYAQAQAPYGGGYGETPAGGVWVPQQRTDETYGGELPQEQPYPYQNQGHGQAQQQPGAGYDEQYRF
ncbi:SCO2102 family sporulation regulator [Streptomyces sp. NPDC004059]|uniref:SCO2102 family sporulation regulator n=1 Tax=Streptomyces sp. NPDC051896 TaxID=3155416 RepID=UPI0034401197